ncbi:MAG: PD40 domain-containing protein [Acidobacteria bacterium]|nr:PD40 domain-containing protein [Acidobacteriota bacterium]
MNTAQTENARPTFRFDVFELLPHEHRLTKNGEDIRVPVRVFDALTILVEADGQVVTKDLLTQRLWPDSIVEENNLSQAISALRKVLGTQQNGRAFIETVPRVGYRFLAPINVNSAEASPVQVEIPSVGAPAGVKRGVSWKVVAAVLIALLIGVAAIISVLRYVAVNSGPAAESGPKRLTSTSDRDQVAGWSNDGQILFTRRGGNNVPETYRISPDGGEPVRAVDLPDVRQAVWSPDGTRIVFSKFSDSGAGTYLSMADGSNAHKLPFSAENVSWAPDGSKFAFQADSDGTRKLASTEVLVYSLQDDKVAELTANTSFDGDPGWSPDGGTIVFSSERDGNYEIYSMKADGSDVRRLTNNPGHDSFPKFSPDGTLISFNSNFESELTDIYLMRPDGSHVMRLTNSKGYDFSRNGWSPDGTKFAYNSDVEGSDDVYVMNVDPFPPTKVIEIPDADLQTPAYSPDGQKIVFTAAYGDHSELRVFDRTTGTSSMIVRTTSSKNYPRWSPDGKWIAFHQEDGGRWDIFKVRPDGTDLTNLTNDPSSDSVAVWSADSATIYFRSARNTGTETAEFFKMNADGTGQVPLPIRKGKIGWPSTSLQGGEIVFAADRDGDPVRQFDIFAADIVTGSEHLLISRRDHDTQPSLSPDGKLITFVSLSDGNPEIYVANSDGTMPLRLTRNSARDQFPSFSPDGKKILFTSDRGGKAAIYEVSFN